VQFLLFTIVQAGFVFWTFLLPFLDVLTDKNFLIKL
jgi:hypothetical protein